MRFVFPVLFSVMIAMLFVSFYARLPPPLPFSTSDPICRSPRVLVRYKSSRPQRHLRPT